MRLIYIVRPYRVIARDVNSRVTRPNFPETTDCDNAFAERYKSDPADPSIAQELTVWREAWRAALK